MITAPAATAVGALGLSAVVPAATVWVGKRQRATETGQEQPGGHQAGRRGDANPRTHFATTPRSTARRNGLTIPPIVA
jgi:hypothetical protein